MLLHVQPALSADLQIMPQGFEQVELGMDWKSFLAIRPHAEIFNIFPEADEDLVPDPGQPQEGLVETFPDGSEFSRGFYVFEHGRLVAMMFGSSLKDEAGHRESFMRKLATQHGIPAATSLINAPPNHGVIIWQKGDTQVHAIVPLSKTISGDDLILRIVTSAYAERLKLVKPSDKAGSERTTPTETAALNALMQEMAAYARSEHQPENEREKMTE